VIRRLRAAMKAAAFDALVALSQDNTYTADFSFKVTPEPLSAHNHRACRRRLRGAGCRHRREALRPASRISDIASADQFSQIRPTSSPML
jgi:hypothetical protein